MGVPQQVTRPPVDLELDLWRDHAEIFGAVPGPNLVLKSGLNGDLFFGGESAMRLAVAMLVLMSAVRVSAQDKEPRTPRDYFNELKAANNFNHYKDTYVCFADDDTPSFAVVARGSDIIDEMKKAGAVPDKVVLQAKSLLFVETYYKGISNKTEVYEPVGKEGTDWDIEFNSPSTEGCSTPSTGQRASIAYRCMR